MRIYQCTPSAVNTYAIRVGDEADGRQFDAGKFYTERMLAGAVLPRATIDRDFRLVGEGPSDCGGARSKGEVGKRAVSLRDWLKGPVGVELGWGPLVLGGMQAVRPITARDFVSAELRKLIQAAVDLGFPESPDMVGLDRTDVLALLNRLAQFGETDR